jgi:hypothetical protein
MRPCPIADGAPGLCAIGTDDIPLRRVLDANVAADTDKLPLRRRIEDKPEFARQAVKHRRIYPRQQRLRHIVDFQSVAKRVGDKVATGFRIRVGRQQAKMVQPRHQRRIAGITDPAQLQIGAGRRLYRTTAVLL